MARRKKYSCILITLEGVLVDIETPRYEAFTDACINLMGVTLSILLYNHLCKNKTIDTSIQNILEYFRLQGSTDAIRSLKSLIETKFQQSLKKNISINTELIDLLQRAKKKEIKILLLSKLPILDLNNILRISKLNNFFHHVFTDSQNSKRNISLFIDEFLNTGVCSPQTICLISSFEDFLLTAKEKRLFPILFDFPESKVSNKITTYKKHSLKDISELLNIS